MLLISAFGMLCGVTKEAFITDYRNTIDWDIAFIRDVHDWNLGVLSPFLNFILAHTLKN